MALPDPQLSPAEPRLAHLLDVAELQRLADANYAANGMPIGIVDAIDGSVLVGCGWQEICVKFHRVHPESLARCRESDAFITAHLSETSPCEYTCRNGLRDIGVPILVGDRHLATLFLGQFFYEGEIPDRRFFAEQARLLGYDEREYLAALDRVPVFARRTVENVVAYDTALAKFISELASRALANARSERALREADDRKSQFLGVLSHELRNPLAPIRNALSILDRVPAGGEQARRARAVIDRQVDHLTRLVDDLLDATRISRGKIELQRSPLDLRALVERTVEDHRPMLGERGIALELHLEPTPALVSADPTRIAQVLGNLLQNSAKFTLRGGRVTVAVAVAGDRVRASVRDTGVGIDPALLATVFEPFTQGDDTLHRSTGGLGLGLALVKGLVELHGGRVEAASDGLGEGAEFAFELPRIAGPQPERAEETRCAAARGRRVLVIEDNEDSAETLREVLELSGHETEVANDGKEGLEKARAFRPEIVLCDIGLPRMNGYEVARAIRADDALAGTILIALTGYTLPNDRRLAEEAGFDRHLAKPVSLGVLEEVLSSTSSGAGTPVRATPVGSDGI
jgi:signal transduction histidine kinase/ActR/RegA family two-component response regulator